MLLCLYFSFNGLLLLFAFDYSDRNFEALIYYDLNFGSVIPFFLLGIEQMLIDPNPTQKAAKRLSLSVCQNNVPIAAVCWVSSVLSMTSNMA